GRACRDHGIRVTRLRCPSQTRQVVEPSLDQREAFAASPPLDLLLDAVRLVDAVELHRPHEPDRPATPGVLGSEPLVVLAEAAFEVPGAADVVGTVRTLDDVGEGHGP